VSALVDLVTIFAFELEPQVFIAPLSCYYPGTIDPGRVVTYVLGVAAREISDPVTHLVLVVINNFLFHVPEPAKMLVLNIDAA
jgi:hypothetical protein